MSPRVDYTGKRFGMLVGVSYVRSSLSGGSIWLWQCDCGNKKEMIAGNVVNRQRRQYGCGCQMWKGPVTHGATMGQYSPEYRIWCAMIERCENKNNRAYKNYGGRGIKVCRRWRESYAAFLSDMGPRPAPNYSLDRRDNDGDYKPSNCRWVTRDIQSSNTRRNHLVTIGGKKDTVKNHFVRMKPDITLNAVYFRLQAGWPPEKALTYSAWKRI